MKRLSLLLKWATATSAFSGVFFSLLFAKRHGYSHWSKRLLYFTAQSNLWIGLTCLALLIFPLLKVKNAEKIQGILYRLKYVFTVSITMTGLVFCLLLAPFADASYHVWAFSSILTHVFTPILALTDFLLDPNKLFLKSEQVILTMLPPFFYFSPVILLCAFGVDFGRGVPYPYYFLDFHSPMGFFGVSKHLPALGSVYWLIIFSAVMVGIGWLCLKWNNALYQRKNRSN